MAFAITLCAHGKPQTGYNGYEPRPCWRCKLEFRFWLIRRLRDLF